MRVLSALAVFAVIAAAVAGDKSAKSHFIVIAPHTAEQCLSVLDDIKANDQALLKKIDWGCAAGDHTGYLAVDADSEDAALKSLPEKSRTGARAVKLVKFSPEQIKQFHAGK